MAWKSNGGQLALPFEGSDLPLFENFVGSQNLQSAGILKRLVDVGEESSVFLLGPRGTGKTHLLLSVVAELDKRKVSNGYLSAAILNDLSSEEASALLSAVENYRYIIIDDLNDLVWSEPMQQAFFSLFNFVRDTGRCLVIASSLSIEQMDIQLRDLVSRLNSSVVLRLKPSEDAEKLEVLQLLAHQRGLQLAEDALSFIIKRSHRDLGSLISVLEQLDRASWEAQHKLTIPFIKSVMNW